MDAIAQRVRLYSAVPRAGFPVQAPPAQTLRRSHRPHSAGRVCPRSAHIVRIAERSVGDAYVTRDTNPKSVRQPLSDPPLPALPRDSRRASLGTSGWPRESLSVGAPDRPLRGGEFVCSIGFGWPWTSQPVVGCVAANHRGGVLRGRAAARVRI